MTKLPAQGQRSVAGRVGTWLRRDVRALLSVATLLFLLGAGLLAPIVCHYSPSAQDLDALMDGPGAAHWLGTDDLGRDVLARLAYGAATSLYASCLAVAIAAVLGIPLGLAAGYAGGWLDALVSRAVDSLLSFPAIILAVAVTGVLGRGLTHGMVAVGIVFAPQLARLARNRAQAIRQELYVEAARVYGEAPWWILLRHVLPNALPPVIVHMTLLLAAALLAEASLSFLGLGVQPPQPSWGAMLARAYNYMDQAPGQMIVPGMAILISAVAFNALGESLRDLLDPTADR